MTSAPSSLSLHVGGGAELDEVMLSMTEGFPAAYGEAWTWAQCAAVLSLGGVAIVLARWSGEPAGFALLRTVLDEAELLLLVVRPTVRRRGIARALVGEAERIARQAGAEALHLEMRDGNPALCLYHAAGFAEIGRRRGYYRGPQGETYDAITLSHALHDAACGIASPAGSPLR